MKSHAILEKHYRIIALSAFLNTLKTVRNLFDSILKMLLQYAVTNLNSLVRN
jgi:hypothetical protein